MPKEEFFSKLKIKDYNNELEIALEQKDFSEEAKNLLLGMLYKLEASYEDYSKVKRIVETKKEYIENLIQNIKNNCAQITLIKPQSESSNKLEKNNAKFIINKEEKKIEVFPNEKYMLYAIYRISEEEILINDKYYIIKNSLSKFLNIGNSINNVEVIRDFNGWSWSTIISEIEDVNYNILFQNLQMLVGQKFIKDWIQNKEYVIDYIENLSIKLEENYNKEFSNKFLKILYKIIILIYIQENEIEKKKIENRAKLWNEELDKLSNKAKFLEDLSKQKKSILKRIEKLDKIASDKKLLEKEYVSRNNKLDDNQKIFSINYLVDIINKERQDLLEKLEKCNREMDPKIFIKKEKELKNNIKFIEYLNFENIDIQKEIIELQKAFIDCLRIRIQKIDNKKEILNLIYIVRYYNFIAIKNNMYIKDVKKLKIKIENLEKALLKKAYELKVINKFAEDDDINFIILQNIFQLRTMDFENIEIEIKINEIGFIVNYYDLESIEKNIVIDTEKKAKEIGIKLNKRIKLFA